MSEEQTLNALKQGFSGWLGTVGEGGEPHCTPMLYVFMDDKVYLHSTRAKGLFRSNIDNHSKVCFGVDEPDQVYAYGRFECDSSLAYQSVILNGEIAVIENEEIKQRFCEHLMSKYGKPEWGRPQNFFPRLNQISVYAITIQKLTGKKIELPVVSQQWPIFDRTKTPNAKP
jgi:hypothetical protein